jgi:hypothetical protein
MIKKTSSACQYHNRADQSVKDFSHRMRYAAMETFDVRKLKARLTLRPGQRGTRRLMAEYGDRLVCVRYRYDLQRQKRVKTVEIIVDETDWKPDPQRRENTNNLAQSR